MSKDAMEWHRECFKNFSKHVAHLRSEVERQIATVEQKELELEFYRMQITEAEKRGLDAFDRDRLLAKRSA